LFIKPERLTPGPTTLAYKVTRLQQLPELSGDIPVYVKLDRPGGQDQNGDTPGHSELHLEIDPQIVAGGVDKDQAAAGVPVTIKAYPNMAEHDEIRLSWGGQVVSHTVLAAEVNKDIELTVDQATILAAGDSDAQGLAVTFEVYDMVDNRSEDWSAEIRLVVDTGSTRLDAPFVAEAINNVLDVDLLDGDDATAQVIARSPNFAVDDLIKVNVRGTDADGVPVDFTSPGTVVTSLNKVFEIPVPNASVRALAKTQAIFSYRLIKQDGSPDLLSKGQFVSIIGEVKRLAAPIAKDASQGSIDPELPRTAIEIPWDAAMDEGQVIELQWLGTRPDLSVYLPNLDLHTISHNESVAKLPISVVVEGTHLQAIDGGTLELYYKLLSDVKTRTLVTRESLHAAVLNVGEPQAELPAPTVLYVQDGALDPEDVPPEGTRLIVPMYNGMISGDEVHYEWMGSETGLATDWIKLNPIIDKKPVPFDIRYDLVADNLGGTVEASYYVIRANGKTSASQALVLPIGFQDFTDFNDGTRNGWTDGPAADPRDWTIVNGPSGSKVLFNHTFTNNSAGVVLKKNVTGLKAGRAYKFALQGMRRSGGTYAPRLSLATSQGAVAGAVTLSGSWVTLTGTFIAQAAALECQLVSHEANGLGNDYYIDNIRISAVGDEPIITSVTDSKGEVTFDGTTFDTTVTVKGKAAVSQQIEVFDGATSKGKPTASGTGDWTLALTGLTVAAHNITAKGLYGSNPVSAARMFTVIAATEPSITHVTDSKGEVENGGTTFDTTVTLKGKAAANQKVQILDGTTSKGEATANPSDDWTLQVTGLSVAKHSITAKGLYSNNPVSPAWVITVSGYEGWNKDGNWRLNKLGQFVVLASGLKVTLSATAASGWDNIIEPVSATLSVVTGSMRMDLPSPAKAISFDWDNNRTDSALPIEAVLFGPNGTQVGRYSFPAYKRGRVSFRSARDLSYVVFSNVPNTILLHLGPVTWNL
jgi:hypothetical protein